MSPLPTMIIVDDHPIVRQGLSDHFAGEFDVVGTSSDAEQAVRMCRELQPDVLLLDIEMPGRDALGAMIDIEAATPATRIVLVTSYCRDPMIDAAIRNGAAGYLLKRDPISELKAALDRILRGEQVYSRDVMERISHRPGESGGTALASLHPRELESLRYIGKGMTNAEMAELMHISIRTVERHVLRLMRALDINERTRLTALAHESGLVAESSQRHRR